MNQLRISGTVVVGGGPGGLAPLLAAARTGQLSALLAAGLHVVEQGPRLGAGELGRYVINSDSVADTFLSCVEGRTHPALAALAQHPSARAIAAFRGGTVPLRVVAPFLDALGERLAALLEDATPGAALTGHQALHTQRTGDGLWVTRLRRLRDGAERYQLSRAVVIATGGHQPPERLATQAVAGEPLLPRYAATLVQSGEVLTQAGLDALAARLQHRAAPRVAIVGGSTSALAAAHALLHRLPQVRFAPGAITLLHRRPLRLTYDSPEAAWAENYREFDAQDICPVSGRVFRLGGFRLEARELVMRARGLGGRSPEPRLRLLHLSEANTAEARQALDAADVVVAALGYRPRALSVLDPNGQPLALHGDGPAMRPLVDRHCRVLDRAGQPIPGLFGIGLAAGFVPWGRLGGEPSFQGQANGLWLWQHDVGHLISTALCGDGDGRDLVAAGPVHAVAR